MSSAPEHPRDCERLIDAAAYVLYALQDTEARSFGEHLETCPICREEVLRSQPVADALAIGVTRVEAPPELGARIMAAVYPEADPFGASGNGTDHVASARSWRRGLIPALTATAALAAGLLIGALVINTSSSERTEVIRAIVVAPGHRATADLRKAGGHVQLVVEGLPAPRSSQTS
jgi:anti-sigma-K factor RskA